MVTVHAESITLWVEGDIATNQILSKLLNDLGFPKGCRTRNIESLELADLADSVPVFCRLCHPQLFWIPEYLTEKGISYVYYIDDNFWMLHGTTPLHKYYNSPEVVRSLDNFVRYASTVITNSCALRDCIDRRFPSVRNELLPPPFDVSFIKRLLGEDGNDQYKKTSSKFIVGYSGGFKAEEFAFLVGVVNALHAELPDIRFEFIGACPEELKSHPAVSWFPPINDYDEYLAFQLSRKWTIGLAPLMASGFNAAKTDNKFREYGGCGIAGVYSMVSPYREVVIHGRTGILVDNSVECWVTAIKQILEDCELHQRMTQGAFAYVEQRYAHDAIANSWREVFDWVSHRPRISLTERIRFRAVKQLCLARPEPAAKNIENAELLGVVMGTGAILVSRVINRRTLKLGFAILLGLSLIHINIVLFRISF